jgi:hypothetical protein
MTPGSRTTALSEPSAFSVPRVSFHAVAHRLSFSGCPQLAGLTNSPLLETCPVNGFRTGGRRYQDERTYKGNWKNEELTHDSTMPGST